MTSSRSAAKKKKKLEKKAKEKESFATKLTEVITGKTAADIKKEVSKAVKAADAQVSAQLNAMLTALPPAVLPAAALEAVAAHDALVDTVYHIKRNLNSKQIFSFVIFLCLCACNLKMAEFYERIMDSSILTSKLWDDNAGPYRFGGALGCVVLSAPESSLPLALREIKAIWVSTNGGYSSIFSARQILSYKASTTIPETFSTAVNHYSLSDQTLLAMAISDKCPGLRFRNYNAVVKAIFSLLFLVKAFAEYFIPEAAYEYVENAIFLMTDWIFKAVIAFFFLFFAFCVVTKPTDQGFLIRIVVVSATITRMLVVFFFGRVLYIVILIVLVFSLWVYAYINGVAVFTSAAAQQEEFIAEVVTILRMVELGTSNEPGALTKALKTITAPPSAAAASSTISTPAAGLAAPPAVKTTAATIVNLPKVSAVPTVRNRFPVSNNPFPTRKGPGTIKTAATK